VVTIQSPAGLSSALDSALQSLQTVSEGDSLCTLRGDRVNAAKYYEGRVVALKALRTAAPDARGQRADELLVTWSREYAAHAAHDSGWSSYLAGLLDTCREWSSSR
jgi:hypothetical protein